MSTETKKNESDSQLDQNLRLVKTKGDLKAVVEIQTNCPICDSSNNRPIRSERNQFPDGMDESVISFNGTWIQLLKCDDCSFGFTKEKPTDPKYFDSRYDLKFDISLEENSDHKNEINEVLFSWVKKFGLASGKHLDVGAFSGKFVQAGIKSGFISEGIEVNPTMANYCKSKLGLNVKNESFMTAHFESEKFDLVSFIDVLEHLWSPMKILEKVNGILKPGGLILIKVPNLTPQINKQRLAHVLKLNRLGVMENYGHINHFSPKALKTALELSGFEDVQIIVARSEYYSNPNLKQRFSNQARKWLPKLMEGFRQITGINLGFNIVAIARKKNK